MTASPVGNPSTPTPSIPEFTERHKFDPPEYSLVPHDYALTTTVPFTYRDGFTYLQVIEELRKWVNEGLRNALNSSLESYAADYNERISKLRIIPARAGFTHDGGGSVGHGEDHPRSRGVYAEVFRKRDSLTGSSPLARGLRRGLSLPAALGGIIPARAGFTRRRGHLHPPARDHPRSRGVY